jgi:predicted metal-binding protein
VETGKIVDKEEDQNLELKVFVLALPAVRKWNISVEYPAIQSNVLSVVPICIENKIMEIHMNEPLKLGIIICDRYRTCAGGKCFRALNNREGAFSKYKNQDVEMVGYTTCDGCPGGNIEYAPEEMKKNGAEVIHLATGLIVGYPPCPYIEHFRDFIQNKYGMKVVIGTHPIPQKYYDTHLQLGTWNNESWQQLIQSTVCNEAIRKSFD